MNPDPTEQTIINEDKKIYPHCDYSVAFSRVCSSRNSNGMECETTRNLQRLCPGQRPLTIYSKKEKISGDGEGDIDDISPLIPKFFRGLFDSEVGNNHFQHSFKFGSNESNQEGFGLDNFADPFRIMEDALSQFAKNIPNRSMDVDKSNPLYKIPPHKFDNWEKVLSSGSSDRKTSKPKPFGDITGPVEEI